MNRPVARDDEDFMARLLSRVEAIPLESLTQGLTFGWSSFPEFLAVVGRAPLVDGHQVDVRQVRC